MHIRLSGTLQIEYLILIEGVWRIPDSKPEKPRVAVVKKYQPQYRKNNRAEKIIVKCNESMKDCELKQQLHSFVLPLLFFLFTFHVTNPNLFHLLCFLLSFFQLHFCPGGSPRLFVHLCLHVCVCICAFLSEQCAHLHFFSKYRVSMRLT